MHINTFGHIFRVTTWGESHGPAIGAVVDGCPPGLPLATEDFTPAMAARAGGNASFTTARKEPDNVMLESGVCDGHTTGTPIALRIENRNVRSQDYADYADVPRPGHADLTTLLKHGVRDHRGGGRSSARETAARVAAGVIADKILRQHHIEVMAFLQRVGSMELQSPLTEFHRTDSATVNAHWQKLREMRDASPLSLPTADTAAFSELIESAAADGDSLGGALDCWVRGLPAGLGEPVFGKLNALLGQAMLSLPAAVGVQVGGGHAMSRHRGSEIRDPIITGATGPEVAGNRHGGLLGGMTTGSPLWLRVDFHAPTSVSAPITSINVRTDEPATISVSGRHDSFPLPRAVPMVEAMAKLTLADALALAGKLKAAY